MEGLTVGNGKCFNLFSQWDWGHSSVWTETWWLDLTSNCNGITPDAVMSITWGARVETGRPIRILCINSGNYSGVDRVIVMEIFKFWIYFESRVKRTSYRIGWDVWERGRKDDSMAFSLSDWKGKVTIFWDVLQEEQVGGNGAELGSQFTITNKCLKGRGFMTSS